MQQFAESDARADADAIAAALQEHKRLKGVYPATLEEIGFDARALREKWYLSYRLHEGKPALFYSAQNMPLAAWHYDVATKAWVSQN